MDLATVILDLEDQIVLLHHAHLNVLSMEHVMMEDVLAELVGQEMIVHLEPAQMHAQDMVFVEIIHVNVMLDLVEMIAVNYFAQILAQIKELVTMVHAIVKVHSEELIVQLEHV